MKKKVKLDFNTLEKFGIYKHKSFFEPSFIQKLKNKCDIIYKSELFLNKFGLGNRSFRNGSFFTGNLLIKSTIFIELAYILQNFINSNNLSNYFLSEFFMVSTIRSDNFSDWWHRDYPHNIENFDLYDKHSIGFFIPVSTFNKVTGSTKVIESSNNNLSLSVNIENTKILSANKGDLIIYDPKMLHTGGSNQTENKRQLIIAIFNRKELIPCENFQTQFDMIFSNYDKKLISSLNIIRYKPMQNFFGRNRSIIDTSYKPIIKILIKFRRILCSLNPLIYFYWTRILYSVIAYFKND